MSDLLKKKLYEMEVPPPEGVWDKLNIALDEMNADILFAEKIRKAETSPPPEAWGKIEAALGDTDTFTGNPGGAVHTLKRLALAAVLIGIILSAYLLFFNSPEKKSDLAIMLPGPATIPQKGNTNPSTFNADPPLVTDRASATPERFYDGERNNNSFVNANYRKRTVPMAIPATLTRSVDQPILAAHATIGDKIFNQPIDDLSMIASNNNYITMVNANGRMVKIPARLSNIAIYLQDKPVEEDYFELMFGEGSFWKEKLKDWRNQAATSIRVSAAGSFFDIVDLLKSVQN